MVRLHDLVELDDVVEVDLPETFLLRQFLGAPLPELEGFVGADVEQRRGKRLRQLGKHAAHKFEAPGISRGDDVPVRRFGDVLVELVLEHVMQVPEGLLFGHDGDVVTPSVGDQFLHLLRRDRRLVGRDQRLAGVVEDVFHVQREQVHLVLGQGPHLFFHVLEGGNRAAADVIMRAAPAHCRPVADRHRRYAQLLRVPGGGQQQLAQRLRAVEHTRTSARHDQNARRRGLEHVAFFVEVAGNLQFGGLQPPANSGLIGARQVNHAGAGRHCAAGGNAQLAPGGVFDLRGDGFSGETIFARVPGTDHDTSGHTNVKPAALALHLARFWNQLEFLRRDQGRERTEQQQYCG